MEGVGVIQPIQSPSNLCRACATNIENNCQDEAHIQFRKFQHLYSTVSELKVYEDDDLPMLLCPTCVALLEAIHIFKDACARSVDSIRKLILANLKVEPIVEIVSAEALEPIVKVKDEDVSDTRTALVKERPMCDLCGRTFSNMAGIRSHMRLKLKNGLVEKLKPNIDRESRKKSRLLYCSADGCIKSFRSKLKLDRHMQRHAETKLSTHCAGCNRTFVGIGHYRRHMEVFHKATGTPNMKCPKCQKTFNTVYQMKAHILKVHGGETKTFDCNTCGVRFVSEYELKTHAMRKHESVQSGKFNYECHHCGEVCYTKRDITVHIYKKHLPPPYDNCNICGRRVHQFKLKKHLIQKHTVRSDLSMEIKCEICDRVYKNIAMLRRHLKTHSGIRPHVCHICGMSFIRQTCLRRHFYTHTGERPIHCEICGKGLYGSEGLKIHMNIHKREWIAQGQTGIELFVYKTSNKSKNSTGPKYANLKPPQSQVRTKN